MNISLRMGTLKAKTKDICLIYLALTTQRVVSENDKVQQSGSTGAVK